MTPTIYEWAGGRDAFSRWLNRFYDLVELEAPEIAIFGGKVSEQHRHRVTDRGVAPPYEPVRDPSTRAE